MSPKQLRAFYAVASTGSFTAAARLLHTTQPPITTHVKELEEQYGVELFRRHGRGAELTLAGRKLLSFAQRIMANQEEAVEYLRDAGNLQTGKLRLGALAPYGITEVLAAFRARYPGIDIEVLQGNSSQLLEELRQYRIDVSLVGNVASLDEFHVVHYSRPEIILLVNREHRWARRKSICIEDLVGEPLIFREEGSNTQRSLEAAAAKASVTLTPALTFGSREGLVASVIRGLGVGPLPEDQFVPHPSLRVVRISNVPVFVDAYLACLPERRESRIVHAFMTIALKTLEAKIS